VLTSLEEVKESIAETEISFQKVLEVVLETRMMISIEIRLMKVEMILKLQSEKWWNDLNV
jgi:hypothetical protein